MNIVYQIKAKGVTAYASNIAACDELRSIMINNGSTSPIVRRMKKSDVPMCDLELVAELK